MHESVLNSTAMKNIIAAAILGASFIAGVMLFIHHEDAIRVLDHRRQKCAEDKKAFDKFLGAGQPGNGIVYQQYKQA
jgi:hypothetical protein